MSPVTSWDTRARVSQSTGTSCLIDPCFSEAVLPAYCGRTFRNVSQNFPCTTCPTIVISIVAGLSQYLLLALLSLLGSPLKTGSKYPVSQLPTISAPCLTIGKESFPVTAPRRIANSRSRKEGITIFLQAIVLAFSASIGLSQLTPGQGLPFLCFPIRETRFHTRRKALTPGWHGNLRPMFLSLLWGQKLEKSVCCCLRSSCCTVFFVMQVRPFFSPPYSTHPSPLS